MKRITSLSRITQAERGAYTAIGNFDGVHLGHQAVLDLTRKNAEAQQAPLAVLTFEPHPREVFRPDDPAFRLMNSEAKAHRLSKLGVDFLYEIPFNKALFGLSAPDFSQQILADGLGVSGVTVGADFCYGKGRAGNAETLRQAGREHGFAVSIAELLGLAGDGERVSSTAIRNALRDGVPRKAAAMLGHWHRIEGPVLHGAKRGRDLGYPTANMDISGIHPPKFGVYAVLVEVVSGPHAGHYRGVASLGIRPMFGENLPNLETHLFDFEGDLYDAHLSVGLVQFLRPEMKFDGVNALIAQIRRDEESARDVLSQVPLVGFPREAAGSFPPDV